MIDIHNHIIAGVDDGAADIEESLEMLKLAENDGTEIIFATPHYIKGVFETDFKTVRKETERLKQLAQEKGIKIDIACGQEIMLDNSVIDGLLEGNLKGLNDSGYILVEFPMDKLPEGYADSLYELRIREYVPVIAHPERYKYILEKPSRINKFIKEGCLFQLNAGSITGRFGKEVKKLSQTLIKNGLCSFIASDAHGAESRTPHLKEAAESINSMDSKLLLRIYKNLSALMADEKIVYDYEEIHDSRSIFSFIKKI